MLVKVDTLVGRGYSKEAFSSRDLPGKVVLCRSANSDNLLLRDYDELQVLVQGGIRATPILDIVDVEITETVDSLWSARRRLGFLMDRYDDHFKVYHGGGNGRQTFNAPLYKAVPYLDSLIELRNQVENSGVGFMDLQFLFRETDHTAFVSDPMNPFKDDKEGNRAVVEDFDFLIRSIRECR